VRYSILLYTFVLALPPFHSSAHAIDHAIYLSVVEIDHSAGGSASIKIKVFTNDMEDALKNEFQKSINLVEPGACESNKIEIVNYFAKHFLCSINGTDVSLSFRSCELTGDAIWFHFEVACPPNWNEIKITADYFLELFPTQSNVVSINHDNKKKFIRLTQSNVTGVVRF